MTVESAHSRGPMKICALIAIPRRFMGVYIPMAGSPFTTDKRVYAKRTKHIGCQPQSTKMRVQISPTLALCSEYFDSFGETMVCDVITRSFLWLWWQYDLFTTKEDIDIRTECDFNELYEADAHRWAVQHRLDRYKLTGCKHHRVVDSNWRCGHGKANLQICFCYII